MKNFFKKLMGLIKVNTHFYRGNNVSIVNGRVFIDGKDVTPATHKEPAIHISVEGGLSVLDVSGHVNTLDVTGDVGSISTVSADVCVFGNVNGYIKTDSGDIECKDVGGDIGTNSGDVDCGKVGGEIRTKSGDITHKR